MSRVALCAPLAALGRARRTAARAKHAVRGCGHPRERRWRDWARSSLLAHPLLCNQARRHAVDAAFADAAAKIPGPALLCELGLGCRGGQRLVDGRDRHPVALGQRRCECTRPPRNLRGAVAFGNADDELPRAPIVDDSIELAPRRLALDAHGRERRRRSRLTIRGSDSYAAEPEVERDEDVPVAVTKTRHVAIRRRQA